MFPQCFHTGHITISFIQGLSFDGVERDSDAPYSVLYSKYYILLFSQCFHTGHIIIFFLLGSQLRWC